MNIRQLPRQTGMIKIYVQMTEAVQFDFFQQIIRWDPLQLHVPGVRFLVRL